MKIRTEPGSSLSQLEILAGTTDQSEPLISSWPRSSSAKKRAGVGSSTAVRPRRHSRAARRRPSREPTTERDRHVVSEHRGAHRGARAGRENTRCNPAHPLIFGGSQRDASTWEHGRNGGNVGFPDEEGPASRDHAGEAVSERVQCPAGHCSTNAGEAVDPAATSAETSPHAHNYGLPEDSQGTGFDECSLRSGKRRGSDGGGISAELRRR